MLVLLILDVGRLEAAYLCDGVMGTDGLLVAVLTEAGTDRTCAALADSLAQMSHTAYLTPVVALLRTPAPWVDKLWFLFVVLTQHPAAARALQSANAIDRMAADRFYPILGRRVYDYLRGNDRTTDRLSFVTELWTLLRSSVTPAQLRILNLSLTTADPSRV